MRCVLDPNVIILGLLSRESAAAKLLRYWYEGEFEVLVTYRLTSELSRGLNRLKIRGHITEVEAYAVKALVSRLAHRHGGPLDPENMEPNGHYLHDLALRTLT